MRLRQLPWLRLCGITLAVLAFLLSTGIILAQETVIVQLGPVGESDASGTATLAAEGEATHVTLDVVGLAPGVDARATMHAGTCTMPSASFAALPDLRADATGRAIATGQVLFHATENVALATMADGEHIIAIHAGEGVVACGVIPRLTSASPPLALPVTGGATVSLTAAMAGVLGLCALSTGLFLWRHNIRSLLLPLPQRLESDRRHLAVHFLRASQFPHHREQGLDTDPE